MVIKLPILGERVIKQDPASPTHWLWLDSFGWHDCSPEENNLINKA